MTGWKYVTFLIAGCLSLTSRSQNDILKPESIDHYFEKFNRNDNELYKGCIPNDQSIEFLNANIPLFECPDKQIEETYYFRWWTYRKHIKKTAEGFVITEFLPNVPWAGKDNAISCAAAYHFNEGRWIRSREYLNSYANYWFHSGGSPRSYSFWPARALFDYFLVTGDRLLLRDLYPDLQSNFRAWENEKYDGEKNLFWQIDGEDGMEVSVSGALSVNGSGYRSTINSYMYAEAEALAEIGRMLNENDKEKYYSEKAKQIKRNIIEKLWNEEDTFFEVIPKNGEMSFSGTRELHGYTPWAFCIPDDQEKYSAAWKQIMSESGFFAPYGLTTTEQRSPDFKISYVGHECQWNGPSWPYATSMTLVAISNLLNNYHQDFVSKKDFFRLFEIYSESHQLKDNGKTVNWIDENLNPYSGDWIARTRLKSWKNNSWSEDKGGVERGKDYNHSLFCDLIISHLIGFKPCLDGSFEIRPLVTDQEWDYFCLDNLWFRSEIVTILYDKTGNRYKKGKGLKIRINGKEVFSAPRIQNVRIPAIANLHTPD
ncbi:MAG: amylo-alpha-1,6-glucosidase [Mangrovibacterium sp.]